MIPQQQYNWTQPNVQTFQLSCIPETNVNCVSTILKIRILSNRSQCIYKPKAPRIFVQDLMFQYITTRY